MKRPPAHPLIGQMARLSPWQIGVRLEEMTPTAEELDRLAREESRRPGGDRSSVWRLPEKAKKALVGAALVVMLAACTAPVVPPKPGPVCFLMVVTADTVEIYPIAKCERRWIEDVKVPDVEVTA